MPFWQNNDEPTIFVGMVKLIVSWLGVILSIFIVVVFVVWGFSLNVSDNSEIPVVKAKVKEFRVVSEEPGGQIVSYQGLSVNSVQEKGSAQIAANEIKLAPEPINLIENKIIAQRLNSFIEKTADPIYLSEQIKKNEESINDNNPVALSNIFTSVRPKSKNYMQIRSLTVETEASTSNVEIEDSQRNEEVQEVILQAGTHFVELGSYRTKDKAINTWSSLAKGNSLNFRNKEQLIQVANINGVKLFKLRVLGFKSVIESRHFCEQLRDWITICIPVRAK